MLTTRPPKPSIRSKYTHIIMRVFIHSLCCVLNFILSARRQILPKLPAPRNRLSRPGLEHIPNAIEQTPEEANSYSACHLIAWR